MIFGSGSKQGKAISAHRMRLACRQAAALRWHAWRQRIWQASYCSPAPHNEVISLVSLRPVALFSDALRFPFGRQQRRCPRTSDSGRPMSAATVPVRYRFSRFELQPDERRLLDAGVPVTIGPRAFDLLVALVERAGHLVTKDELLERVWPKVIVEEAALQMQISALRKALGRDAIVTVTGRGYRFALAVACVGAEPAASPTMLRHNLPQPLTSFIGREKQISEQKMFLLHRSSGSTHFQMSWHVPFC